MWTKLLFLVSDILGIKWVLCWIQHFQSLYLFSFLFFCSLWDCNVLLLLLLFCDRFSEIEGVVNSRCNGILRFWGRTGGAFVVIGRSVFFRSPHLFENTLVVLLNGERATTSFIFHSKLNINRWGGFLSENNRNRVWKSIKYRKGSSLILFAILQDSGCEPGLIRLLYIKC